MAKEDNLKAAPSYGTVVGDILQNRPRLFETIRTDRMWLSTFILLLVSAVLLAVYGFVMVMHVGFDHASLVALKFPIVFLSSILLTMPTLYVFSAIRGTRLSLREMFTSTLSGIGLTSIVMIALIPIIWLFAYSNASETFLKVLNFFFVTGSLIGGFVTINGAFKHISNHDNPEAKGYKGSGIFALWTIIFLLVFAQMLANFGPFFDKSTDFVRKERKSFVEVFFVPVDKDEDGLSDKREEELGTNPKKKDTDGDKVNDFDEVDSHYTNPQKKDTDGDSVSDYEELNNGYGTSPTSSDTDGDGKSDKFDTVLWE
jgi:hypothetical protein